LKQTKISRQKFSALNSLKIHDCVQYLDSDFSHRRSYIHLRGHRWFQWLLKTVADALYIILLSYKYDSSNEVTSLPRINSRDRQSVQWRIERHRSKDRDGKEEWKDHTCRRHLSHWDPYNSCIGQWADSRFVLWFNQLYELLKISDGLWSHLRGFLSWVRVDER